jgi:hypothetical protein
MPLVQNSDVSLCEDRYTLSLQALQYLFRLIDFRGQGYLDAFTLNYYFRVSAGIQFVVAHFAGWAASGLMFSDPRGH